MLKTILQNAPQNAGIYQFFDTNGTLLYIGKAKILKNRLKSYFRFSKILSPAPNLSSRITKMVNEVCHIEYIVVQSEHDALILENSLIKQLKPKYNILLRDDKTYPYICLDLRESFPRFEITRKIISHKKMHYVGPFSSSAKALLDALYLCFPLVQKKGCLKGKKACLFFQMERCLAPCEGRISEEDYGTIVQHAFHALSHPNTLLERLHVKMENAAFKLNFEEAGNIRDMIQSIQGTMHSTHVELLALGDYDIFAVESMGSSAVIMRLFIRNGKIVSTSHSMVHHVLGFEKEELYQRAIFDFYHPLTHTLVRFILVADFFEGQIEIEAYLSEKFAQKISISTPQKGKKRPLIEMAKENARTLLNQHLLRNNFAFHENLQNLLDLQSLPRRIEIFDNSHLGGLACVGAMVVWEEKFIKSSYRKYTLHEPNEYAQMNELLSRRIKDASKEPLPDLWILDGGATLLKLAVKLLKEAGICIDVIAIAKEKIDAKANRSKGRASDTLYTKNTSFNLPTSDKRLHFIQKLRDEAHRFAITFHQQKKRTKDLESALLEVEGIGQAKLKKLIHYFGSFEAIYLASQEELEVTLGKKTSEILWSFLNK